MDESTLDHLLSHLSETKKAYIARRDDEGVLRHNVANFGTDVGSICKVTRGGDYTGLSVEVLTPIVPLITDELMKRVLLALKKEAVVTAMETLHVDSVEQLYSLIDSWFSVATFNYKSVYDGEVVDIDERRLSDVHTPLQGRIRLLTIVPTIPEEWAGSVFESGDELQKEWSSVRQGPPVTYAVTYGMTVLEEDSILSSSQVNAEVYFFVDGSEWWRGDDAVEEWDYVVYDEIAIGFRNLMSDKSSELQPLSVGRLVSQLQKCVRRGPLSSGLLVDTAVYLSTSPDYHVPERNFERVSAARQLAWRSFVSILEDAGPIEGLEYLALLTLIYSRVRGRMSEVVLEKVVTLLLSSLSISDLSWRKQKVSKVDRGHDPYSLVLRFIPMMEGDRVMFSKYLSMKNERISGDDVDIVDDDEVSLDVQVRSIDHHCSPFTTILLHACNPSYTLPETAGRIWDESSAYNYRYSPSLPPTDSDIYKIQDWIRRGEKMIQREVLLPVEEDEPTLTPYEARIVFISLFGKSYKSEKRRVCYAGTPSHPAKVMEEKKWIDSQAAPMSKTVVKTNDLPLPLGHSWRKNKYEVEVRNSKPYVDGEVVEWYDASSLVIKEQLMLRDSNEDEIALIESILGMDEIQWEVYGFLLSGGYFSKEGGVPEWSHLHIDRGLAAALLVRLEECGESFEVGPIDRNGVGTKRALYEKYEGRLWGTMILFHYLYPGMVKRKSHTTFHIDRLARDHIISSLMSSLSQVSTLTIQSGSITTKLWSHQEDSVRRILTSFTEGAKGAGDAGDVGSGKTLTAITIALSLPGKSLILMNTPALLPTWTDEVKKHTEGVKYRLQSANGTWSGDEDAKLWITTLARLRDHPTSERWSLLIIDECLSVQNNKALWTAEAWRQSVFADHVLMLSATFFRSRYDKLYFMLKMLRTGLPERKDYLDAILLETMVSQQPSKTRKWNIIHHPIEVEEDVMDKQRKILESNLTIEAKYSKIVSILHDVDVISALRDIIRGSKCLIYARSNEEATEWSKSLSIPIYPDISKNHVIVTLSRGTHGLNDLVKYNTIVCRPPEPDRLPQMKGRLDRPGQQETQLELIFFYLQGTIEEGGLKRLEVARQFDKYYKMPLSKYYEVSLKSVE